MHRFFVPPSGRTGREARLSEADSHHAARVLRLQPGDVVELLDGEGLKMRGRAREVDRRQVVVEIEEEERQTPRLPVGIAPALLKGRAMDTVFQKATELGAVAVWPLVTERCVARVDSGSVESRVAGWRTTAIEACKQCGNPWLPEIHPPQTLDAFLRAGMGGVRVAAMLGGTPKLIADVLDGLGELPEAITLMLGPEGDFTPAEEKAILESGALSITLGPLVLRADTAAIAGLAILQHELARRIRRIAASPPR